MLTPNLVYSKNMWRSHVGLCLGSLGHHYLIKNFLFSLTTVSYLGLNLGLFRLSSRSPLLNIEILFQKYNYSYCLSYWDQTCCIVRTCGELASDCALAGSFKVQGQLLQTNCLWWFIWVLSIIETWRLFCMPSFRLQYKVLLTPVLVCFLVIHKKHKCMGFFPELMGL